MTANVERKEGLTVVLTKGLVSEAEVAVSQTPLLSAELFYKASQHQSPYDQIVHYVREQLIDRQSALVKALEPVVDSNKIDYKLSGKLSDIFKNDVRGLKTRVEGLLKPVLANQETTELLNEFSKHHKAMGLISGEVRESVAKLKDMYNSRLSFDSIDSHRDRVGEIIGELSTIDSERETSDYANAVKNVIARHTNGYEPFKKESKIEGIVSDLQKKFPVLKETTSKANEALNGLNGKLSAALKGQKIDLGECITDVTKGKIAAAVTDYSANVKEAEAKKAAELLEKSKSSQKPVEEISSNKGKETSDTPKVTRDAATPVTDVAKKAEAGFWKKLLRSEESNYEKIHLGKTTGVAAAAVALVGGAYMLLRGKPDNRVKASTAQLQSRANEPSQGAALGV